MHSVRFLILGGPCDGDDPCVQSGSLQLGEIVELSCPADDVGNHVYRSAVPFDGQAELRLHYMGKRRHGTEAESQEAGKGR